MAQDTLIEHIAYLLHKKTACIITTAKIHESSM